MTEDHVDIIEKRIQASVLSSRLSDSTKSNTNSRSNIQTGTEATKRFETFEVPDTNFIIAEELDEYDANTKKSQEFDDKDPFPIHENYQEDIDSDNVKNGGMKLALIFLMTVLVISVGANIWLGL